MARYYANEPYTVISGYAGSGKSTIIKYIISALRIPQRQVAYIAYTGKAANILKQKGCPNATTAHKLLYWARPTPNGHFVFVPRTSLESDYKLIVVDEVSMLPKDMWELLLNHHVYVLAAGDPGQLPPIDPSQDNHVLDKPHIFFDEIMRQAQDSAIIRLSMHIREGKDFKDFASVSGEVRIVHSAKELCANESDYKACLLGAGQILCATNKHREKLNQEVRQFQNRSNKPEVGDKVIGLTNHWDCFSNQMTALTNGAIGEIVDFGIKEERMPSRLQLPNVEIMHTDILMDDGDFFTDVPIDYKKLKDDENSLTANQLFKLRRYIKNYRGMSSPPLEPYDFTYGYAITTWKAQGSEFENVLAFDATWLRKKDPEEYIKYLYTSVTRAQKRLILVGD